MELQVNPQIVHAVETTRKIVVENAPQIGGGIVYQQVAQSMGLTIQDSATYLSQMLVLDSAVTAKVAELIFLQQMQPAQGAAIIALFQSAVQSSRNNLQEVGQVAKAVLEDFKSLLGG